MPGLRLRVHLAVAFVLVVALVAIVSAVQAYHASSRLLLSASGETFAHVARQTGAELAAILGPTRQQLELLARHPVTSARDRDGRLAQLEVLGAALQANRSLAAVHVGYDDGDYLVVRAERHGSPQGARPDSTQPALDPRTEPWFYRASASGVLRTDLYAEPGSGEVSTAFSRRAAAAPSVVRLDIALGDLSARLREQRVSPSAQIALIDADGHVIAHPENAALMRTGRTGRPRLSTVFELGQEPLAELYERSHGREHRVAMEIAGREWIGEARALRIEAGTDMVLLLAAPADELLLGARGIARDQLVLGLAAALVVLPLAWGFSRTLSRPLERLAGQARAIRAFDFAAREPVRSRVIEVDDLARATDEMRATIKEFLDRSTALAAEQRLDRLLDSVVADAVRALDARGGRIRLAGEADAEASVGILAVPLVTRDGERVGVLELDLGAAPERAAIAFIEALAATAAVAIETRQLLAAQKALLESLIQIVAGAIDAKSPYTGGHCQRVPALARMLAEAACAARDGPFRDFSLSEKQWETLHIASWLHDCGKVTTPEYVVDKATKLETLHNRLHEIRTRFEVLKRDAEIEFWRSVSAGAQRDAAQRALEDAWRTLDEEFAFIARCNVGGEAMSAEDVARVKRIATRTWTRTLDDRVGLSEDERRRRAGGSPAPPPAVERLLDDKPEHLVPRAPEETMPADNAWGFRLAPPAYKFDRGEVHNLTVTRGTLTDEERFVINDHIVQTIVMLSKLPFPRHLREVPEVAGGHHERMDGRGYPRALRGAEMSVLARIMAIADVFEALTASDRPYKSGKTVQESLAIMKRMAESGHIDADLYALFVESGVCWRYAERFLSAPQAAA
jgi:HD-GYP domain-containing protein (c-di-GMP phosphodiesterase class II)